VFDTLTVRELLMSTARLKLPETVKHPELKRRVDEIIEKLDIGKCADTQVGKCSGGERRRLASASELISNPYLVFLDEPTSGLDGASALNVMTILRKLAHEEGRTIICTIHQPRASLLPVADQLVLLADGRQVYTGPTWTEGLRDGVLSYFAQMGFPCPAFENPADSIVDLINTVRYEDEEDDKKKEKEGAAATIDGPRTGAGAGTAGDVEMTSTAASGEASAAEAVDADAGDAEAGAASDASTASVSALSALAVRESSPGAVDASGWADGSEAHALSLLKPKERVQAAIALRLPMSREAFVEWLARQYTESDLFKGLTKRVAEADMPLNPLEALGAGASKTSRYPTSFWTQLWVVLKRVMVFKLREPEGIATLAVAVVLTCTIVGLVYLQLPVTSTGVQDRIGFLSVFLVTIAFAPLELVLLMPRERAVFLRDTNANLYGTAAFYLGRTLADLPFHLGFAAIGAIIGYWMVGFQNDAAKFGTFLLMCVVLMFTAASLLLAISSISPDVASANGLASLILLLAMLFSGIFIGESHEAVLGPLATHGLCIGP
jgi:ATP-binding cassette subfamily G (WHITE) protein 2